MCMPFGGRIVNYFTEVLCIQHIQTTQLFMNCDAMRALVEPSVSLLPVVFIVVFSTTSDHVTRESLSIAVLQNTFILILLKSAKTLS